jgi:signal transduction histidine kinase
MRESVAHAMHRRSVSDELRANQQKLELLKEEIQNQQLQLDSVRTRFEIYASILHDLNSPLTIIGGYIGTISDQIAEATRLDGQDIAQINHRLLLIRRQVQNCIEISHRYLRFLRQPPAENPAVPINQVLADLGHLLRAHPAARGHQLLIETLPRDVQAKINATELIQILLNLAVNALQATPQPHEVRIHGHRLAVPLNMAQFSDGPHDRFVNRDGFHNIPPLAVLVVTDNGPGIPPEVMPKLFEPFFTTKPNGRGTGLGLASVLRLLRQAHGAIALYSQPGHGASFTLYLPVKEASANPLA